MSDMISAGAPTKAETIVTDATTPGVLRIILHRPDRLNALTKDLLLSLRAALEQAAEDEAIRCVVLSGSGRAFCSGQDLNDRDPRTRETMPDLEAIQINLFHPIVSLIRTMPKPVIAAVNGIAAGAGASMALAADIVLGSKSARFIFSFSKIGLSADAGLGWQLVKTLGSAQARGLLLTGGTLTAEQAQEAGLIWQTVDDDDVTEQSTALATQLATGPTQAYAGIKSAVTTAEHTSDFSTYLKQEAQIQGQVGRTNDYREGVLAFLEKRDANFKGE